MRSIEYLVQLYPDKTGKELLEIQKQEKLEDEKKFQKANKKKLDFINDINTNGGYFKGTFGLEQYYYYRVFDCQMDGTEMYGSVESVVLHVGRERGVTRPGEISFERRTKTFQKLENYALTTRELCERVTVKEWNAVNEYVDSMAGKFWTLINPKG